MNDPGTSDSPTFGAQLRYHLVGTPQARDVLVYDEPDTPEHLFCLSLVCDGRYALLHISRTLAAEEMVKIAKVDVQQSYEKGQLDWRRLSEFIRW